MKQTTKYILALVVMILSTIGIMANGKATYIYKLNGADPGNYNPGTVVYSNGVITVTPNAGYYLTGADLTVVKTVDGDNAEARRRTPDFDNSTISVTAQDPSADPSKVTKYNITVTDPVYDYEITANFHTRMNVSGATVTVNGGPYTYDGSVYKPDVTVTLGGKTLTKDTDYNVYCPDSIKAGVGKVITVVGIRTYMGTNTDATYTINKAAGSVSFATSSVGKTFGDAPFTNEPDIKGDGTVSKYSSSNTAVATVDANGLVTILGNGNATITVTVADGANYTYSPNTATYTVGVGTAAMTVTAIGYTGTYDDKAHGISVAAPDGATVMYGTSFNTYDQTASPTYTNAGSYPVYYQVTKPNFTTVTGSQTVTINKAAGSISYTTSSMGKTFGDAPFTNALDNNGDGKITGYSSSNTAVATVDANGLVTIVGNGNATITATVADGTNYTYATKTASYTLIVGSSSMTVTATGYTGTYDGKAHGISVTAPDGATVMYGTSANTYDQTASPTFTNAGSYPVYYQVTKANFTTVTGSQTVTINKAAATISFASAQVNKTFGDAAFTNALENKGDGQITGYNSSNTAVATVDANGLVTIVGNGNATITATVADGTNYTYATKTASYTLTVGSSAMTVTATGYTGTYDGKAHGISVTAPDGATVKYGTVAGTYNLDASPTYTNAGSYTVYYQVTKANFTTVTGSQTVTISKAAATISFASAQVNKTFDDAAFTNALENKGDGKVTYSSSNTAVATVDANGLVTIVGNGNATITATVADGTNYTYATKTASYTLTVGSSSMTVTATGYTGTYDGKAHGISVTAPDGATVMYGTVAGTYNLDASPTFTNAGTYPVYYQVTKPNFTTVTGSQNVTISKAAGSISFASAQVDKTFGDAAFTNALENKGDGKVTYSSSNTAVATVDANGKVTIVGSGNAIITATVADGINYTYATKTTSYQLKVGTAALGGVSATGYTGAYDAKAHCISVTAPDGATVKYGTVAGTYDLTASPTYTNAGTYTVYYQVTKANFTTVIGSQIVSISKAAATIGFASAQVDKTFGDAAFTNALENKGDGKVTYSSSNTAVATVDANGKVTIVGSDDATITATVADGVNYTYATKTTSYLLKVGTAALSGVSATGYTGTYDGNAHGISVTAPADATVRYGESDGTYNLDASPTYTNAGTYIIYYQVTKPNYTTVTGSETVTISKANAQVLYVDYVFTTKMGETFNPPYLTLNPANLAVTYSSSDEKIATVDAQTGEVTLVSPGEVKIYAYFAGDANYNSAYDYYNLTVLQRDIDPIDEDVVYLMDDEHFMYTNEDGHTKEVKLDNTIIYDILFTLNIDGDPSESDGYDETEHCIVLNHHMYDSRLYNLIFMGVEPGSKEYAEEYTGLTFKVPAGTGYIIIDSRTDGEHWMKVQIGDLAPVAFCHMDREKDYILYECEKDTWVHVYNGGLVSDVSMAPFHRAKKTKGHVMIYSITRKSSAPAGIERISSDVLESDRWYDLQGNKIQRPTKKGLYILDGQKVIVR